MKRMLKIWIILLASLVLVLSSAGCPSLGFTVTTGIVTNISSDTATLHGRLDKGVPEEFSVDVWFYWGEDDDSLSTAGAETTRITKTKIGEFTAELTGLTPGTKYYFMAYAKLPDGSEIQGAIHNFTTSQKEVGEEEEEVEEDWVLNFADDAFNNDDWRAEQGGYEDIPTSFSQESQDSNAYRQMVHTYQSLTGQMVGLVDLHLFLEGEYDPSICGAIDYLDFSVDIRLNEGPIITHRFVVFQDDKWYWAGYRTEQELGTWRMWEVRLTESDFSLIDLDAVDPWVVQVDEHPDFSENGSPIMFGYCSGGRAYQAVYLEIVHSIDNWEVIIIPVSAE
jgi:hypothetical protein